MEERTRIKICNLLYEYIQKVVDEIIEGLYYDEEQGCTFLANGQYFSKCTNSAFLIVQRLGGKVMGYCHMDNPTAIIGKNEFGHDFALLGSFLIDIWYKDYYEDGKFIYNLNNEEDFYQVIDLYGDPTTWEEVYTN